MLVSAGLLAAALAITRAVDARATRVQRAAGIPLKETGILEILGKDRYLLWIAGLMILLNFVNTTGEYLLGKFLTAEAARQVGPDTAAQEVFIVQFTGQISSLFSVVGMILQLFFVSRILRYAGVGAALCILPVLALTGYSMILAIPLLGMIQWVKIFENGTDYSIQNTARQALFLPTTREAKYKAKAAIDSFFVRMGDVCSAALVWVGTHWLILDVKGFAAANLVLTAAWLAVALVIGREYRRRTEPVPRTLPAGAAAEGFLA
jgi:AAA family ATP:ADP antiporter